ncbi:MAG: hypothetical protein GVY06_03585 [Alphaproteobacteria bacterium]|jgi:hypothetical protein|nr:hypothetical protein [Alphaproteobacteria bacterium]
MIRGLPASLLIHAAVIASGYIVLPGLQQDLETTYTAVPVDIVNVSQVPDVAPRVERDRETVDEAEEEEPPPLEEFLEDLDTLPGDVPPEEEAFAAEEATPPPPQDEEAPPLPDPQAETRDDPEPEEPEPDPAEEEELLARPSEEDELADLLGEASNLFDKTPKEPARAPPKAPEPEQELEDETPAPSEARKGAGERRGDTTSVIAMIQSQMTICWDDVDDLPNPERLNVTIEMTLNRDGTLKRDARLVKPSRAPIGDRPMQVAIERALRAARKCAPYRLPEEALDYYEDWDEVTLNIGPAYK